RKEVLKVVRQRKSKIQPVEGEIPLQAIKRKINLLQEVVEAQADFVDRMKEVNNKRILENGKKIKMKHEAMQKQTERAEPGTDQNIQIETEGTRIQQMEVDSQHVTNLEIEENLKQGKEKAQKMDTEETRKQKGTNKTKERLSYSAVLTGKNNRKVRDNNSE
ncbi:20509_t:CDS:2, partial [Gigaspora margarita]